MSNLLNITLNNNFIYLLIIIALVIIIVITVLSIKKDRDRIVKKRIKEIDQPIEEAKTEEERIHAKLELEKVVNSMKNDLEKKEEKTEIMTYEQEQEERAIISYQELVAAVRKNTDVTKPQTEIGMEVASKEAVEEPMTVEEIKEKEELTKSINSIIEDKPRIDEYKEPELNLEQPRFRDEEYIKEQAPKELPKKFHTSEFISPIYGRNPQIESKKVTPIDNEVDSDLKNTEEFLDSLKKFRTKL